MNKKKDYYEVLGINKNASLDEIKSKYRKLAHMYHPDKNLGNKQSEELFKEATEAYSVLSNDQKRMEYDQFGHATNDFSNISSDIFGDFLGNIVEDLFGSKRSNNEKEKKQGSDLKYKIILTLEEAVYGCVRKIKFSRQELCNSCLGSGGRGGIILPICEKCSGSGVLKKNHGFFFMTQACLQCKGTGHSYKDICFTCKGEGRELRNVELDIKISGGVGQDDVIQMKSEGDLGLHGNERGNLFIYINLSEHPTFKRKENNIYSDVAISFIEAALGGLITVPTLYGDDLVRIEPGTQPGYIRKIIGKGLATLICPQKGDHYVRITVIVPKNLTEKQIKILREFNEMSK